MPPGRVDAPPKGRAFVRGLLARCPRCGSGGLFSSWFTLRPRCPRCGLRFEREEGFWLGAYVVNFAVTEGLVGLLMFGWILWAVGHPGTPFLPAMGAGLVLAVAAPALFFRSSRTVWAALDLVSRPLDPAEEADAAAHAAHAPDPA